MLDIRRLQALQAVARHGSIAAAARSLHFTAPAVSQQLAALERETNSTLFHRTARSIRLTDDGVLLASHADIVLSQLESASNALAANRNPAGPLRIAAFPTAISGVLADALRALAAKHPAITTTVIDVEPDAAENLLRKDHVDVAITHHYDLVPRTRLDLVETTPLYDEPMLFVCASGTSAPSVGALCDDSPTETVDLGSMRSERWILPPLGSTCHEHVQRACGAAGFVPDIAAQCTEYHGTLALVRAGIGVALVPAAAVDDRERAGLCVIPTEPSLRRFVAMRVPAGRTSPAVRSLAECLTGAALSIGARVGSSPPMPSGIST